MDKELAKQVKKHRIYPTKTIKHKIEETSVKGVIKEMQKFLTEYKVKDAYFEANVETSYGDQYAICEIHCNVNKTEDELRQEVKKYDKYLEEETKRKREMYEKLKKEFD